MNKEILRIAFPNIINNITIPLLGMDNSAILGHLESGIYISTVALGSMIFSFIFFNRIFTRTADIYSAYYKALKAEAMVTGWF